MRLPSSETATMPPTASDRPDASAIRRTITDCLDAAGDIQRRYYRQLSSRDVTSKTREFDLLTVADTRSEEAIVARIRDAFPSHAILAEETGRVDRPGATVRWIVDPIDGTLNYRHGFPHCGVSIAVEVDGELRHAAIENSIRRERYEAERGLGATCNGEPIRVNEASRLADCPVVAGFPYDRRERIDHYTALFREFMLRAQGVYRLGSAALDLCLVAAGQVGGYYEENIEPWDWSAGVLIVEEAGGRVTDYQGGTRLGERREFCASNGSIHEEMLSILGPAARR